MLTDVARSVSEVVAVGGVGIALVGDGSDGGLHFAGLDGLGSEGGLVLGGGLGEDFEVALFHSLVL